MSADAAAMAGSFALIGAAAVESYKIMSGAVAGYKSLMDEAAARGEDLGPELAGQVAALEETLGLKGTVELFANIGKKLGEDRFVGDGTPAGGDVSPEVAKVRLEQLGKDKGWMARLLSGDRMATEEKERLNANALGLSLSDYRRAKSAA